MLNEQKGIQVDPAIDKGNGKGDGNGKGKDKSKDKDDDSLDLDPVDELLATDPAQEQLRKEDGAVSPARTPGQHCKSDRGGKNKAP